MCGNHNIIPAHFFFGNCSIQCRISMGNNTIIEESGKGGIILYQTPDVLWRNADSRTQEKSTGAVIFITGMTVRYT